LYIIHPFIPFVKWFLKVFFSFLSFALLHKNTRSDAQTSNNLMDFMALPSVVSLHFSGGITSPRAKNPLLPSSLTLVPTSKPVLIFF